MYQAILLACLLAGVVSPGLAALETHLPLDGYSRQAWSTENGLPQNSVHALLQTSDGFLWLGTEAGLARFDGYQFRVFDRTTELALAGDDIRCLMEDQTGGLWVGTASGVTRLQRGAARTLSAAEGMPGGAVKSLLMTRDGRIWILTTQGLAFAEVAKLDAKSGPAEMKFVGPAGLDGITVESIIADDGGGVWLATSQGLGLIAAGRVEFPLAALKGVRIDAMARVPGAETVLWVASERGLFRLEHGSLKLVASSASLPEGRVRSLLATRQGVWAAGRNSIALFHESRREGGSEAGRREVFSAGAELPGSQVAVLFEDRNGAVWIGTNGGLCRYVDGRIEREAENRQAVLTLFEDHDGDLWVGTETDGVKELRDRAFHVMETGRASLDATPTSVTQTGDGRIWIGTSGEGVLSVEDGSGPGMSKLPKETNGTETVLALAAGASPRDLWVGTPDGLRLEHDKTRRGFTSADGLADDLIRSLLVARDGAVWIGTQHGLTIARNGGATTLTTQQGLGSNLIGPMLEAPGTAGGSDVWVGTFAGLTQLHSGVARNFTVADGLPGKTITALAADVRGGIWIGTKGQGLARWNGTQFQSFAGSRAVPGEIYALLDDGAGSLWMTSERGIFRVAVAALDRLTGGSTADVPVVSYGAADGLPSVDTASIGYPAAWRLRDGRLCFVTRRGVVAVDPAKMQRDEEPPHVALEEVSIDDRAMRPEDAVSLAPGPLHFAFSFAGIRLSAPQRVQYRYLLEGLDKDWVYAGARRVAYYTNIPHGRYRFRVSARNDLGAWSEPAEMEFELRPHFYQTVWFRGLLVLFVLMLGLGLYAARVRALSSRFALVSAERNRLAREIHDTLAQSFVAVSMRLELMAQMLKSNDGVERCREQINQTRTLVRESLEEARRSIWELRAEGADAQSLPARLARIVQEASARGTGVAPPVARVETTGTYRPLARKLEDELTRIAQEALSNAIRHATARSIWLRLSYALDALRLEVQDDGRGFDPATVPSAASGHFGLMGIRERAGLIGAEVMLESVMGEGTIVRVSLPLDASSSRSAGHGSKSEGRQI